MIALAIGVGPGEDALVFLDFIGVNRAVAIGVAFREECFKSGKPAGFQFVAQVVRRREDQIAKQLWRRYGFVGQVGY